MGACAYKIVIITIPSRGRARTRMRTHVRIRIRRCKAKKFFCVESISKIWAFHDIEKIFFDF